MGRYILRRLVESIPVLILASAAIFLMLFALAVIYHICPNVEHDWRWVTPGSVCAVSLWLLVSLGFKLYVENFGNYNAAYGSIAGVIVLMLWLYLTGVVMLLGGEINAEIEHAAEALRGSRRRFASESAALES